MRDEETSAVPGGTDLPVRRFAALVLVVTVMLVSVVITRSNTGLVVLVPLGVVALGGAIVLLKR